ncbi:fungal-specific transcription factor domain-containing protein [Aspergillus caelatus]|uniref:Fungal-specific transcription factor domain-containing protein n=1 Tax=Aspergillus caelatus TaxID=61420 RepID=A0A5N6ZUD1_9EURO|nr:fungal-specific transcription factor domain-containing protein [Aspergillus caelatus]KAE8360998.1 fungal-specific transcription factor domain-containing protein [Aspergillus caelatus]
MKKFQPKFRRSRPRASQVCSLCRRKKVRCDMVVHGTPCTTCKFNRVTCIAVDAPISRASHTPSCDHRACDEKPPATPLVEGCPKCLQPAKGPIRTSPQELTALPLLVDGRQPWQTPSRTLPGTTSSSQAQLPPFIRPLEPFVDSTDIDYLVQKGALDLPSEELQRALLKAYLNCVHPFLPMLDIHEFLETVCCRRKTNQISLLLYQAVMFSASAHVAIEHLQMAGYMGRKAAQKCLFQKARLLHDVVREPDKISLTQALLLMSHVDETVDLKNDWHWLGVCHSLALALNLHHDPQDWCSNIKRRRLYKRLWWSIYVRDRLIAVELKHPMRIQDSQHNVPWLMADDFTVKSFSRNVVEILDGSEILHNTTQQKDLVMMFIETIKLSVCFGHVLSTQYAMSTNPCWQANSAITLAPKKSTTEPSTTQQCDWELEDWVRQLPSQIRHRREPAGVRFVPNILHLHRALLWLYYLGAVSILHRPHVVPSRPCSQSCKELSHHSQDRLRSSAIDITMTFQYLLRLDLTQCIPFSGVNLLFAGTISHLFDITSHDRSLSALGRTHFEVSIRILQKLECTYDSASLAVSFLRVLARLVTASRRIEASRSHLTSCHTVYSNTPRYISGTHPVRSLWHHPNSYDKTATTSHNKAESDGFPTIDPAVLLLRP